MFQYAAARALALRNRTELVLDARAYAPDSAFSYGLKNLAIHATVGSEDMLPPPGSRPLRYAFWRKFGRSPRFVREKSLSFFDRNIAGLGVDVYLHGYFQSERYFSDFAGRMREELAVKPPPDGENARWLERIARRPGAVALHVRRGDYVSNSKFRAAFGTCPPEYYSNAMEIIAGESRDEPFVHVFSDEPQWVRENLKIPYETVYADHNDSHCAHEDLRLMAACKHNIIANSTFSWWGAWLNPNPEKIVIAPRRWFADPRLDNPDIIPDGWIRV